MAAGETATVNKEIDIPGPPPCTRPEALQFRTVHRHRLQPPVAPTRRVVIPIAALLLSAACSPSGSFDLSQIKSRDDIPQTEEGYALFCDALLEFGPEDQAVTDLHDRLDLDGGLYENVYIPCAFLAEYDVVTEVTDEDRRLAEPSADLAADATFSLFDVTWMPPDDLIMASRDFIQVNEREAPALEFSYATTVYGGYHQAFSSVRVWVRMFDTNAFPEYERRCGPSSMSGPSSDDSTPCIPLGIDVLGSEVHASKRDKLTHVITLDGTRVEVTARTEDEALAILSSLVPSTADELDFFRRPTT